MPVSQDGGLYTRVREDLLAGRLTAEDRLSEQALSERYGMSRTPVREALVRLEQDALIVRNGATARLRIRSAEEINDVYRARAWIEQAIAEDAARRRGELDLLRLSHALEAESALDPRTVAPSDLMAANRLFHNALAAAAHNQTLVDLQDRLSLHVARLAETTLSASGRWGAACRQHEEIVEHVRAGRAEEAGLVARKHMDEARDIRLALAVRTG